MKKINFALTNVIVLVFILMAMVGFFSIFADRFFSLYNIISMLNNLSFIGIVASALTIVMISGELDFSIGGVIGLTTCVSAIIYEMGVNIWIVILAGLLVGVIIGSVNGFFVSIVRVNSLILTFGMMFVTRGISLTITKNQSIFIDNPVFNFIGQARILSIPFPLILFVLISTILILVMRYSKFGRSVYIIGSNVRTAYLSGIRVNKIKFLTFVLSGLSASIGGLILASMSQVGMPQHGMGQELSIISAVVLGGTALAGGIGQISSTILGVIIISVLYNGLTMMNVLYYHVQIAQGLVLVLVVSVYSFRIRSKL